VPTATRIRASVSLKWVSSDSWFVAPFLCVVYFCLVVVGPHLLLLVVGFLVALCPIKQVYSHIGSEVLTAESMKNMISCVATSCISEPSLPSASAGFLLGFLFDLYNVSYMLLRNVGFSANCMASQLELSHLLMNLHSKSPVSSRTQTLYPI
jgi:hypothetical protein